MATADDDQDDTTAPSPPSALASLQSPSLKQDASDYADKYFKSQLSGENTRGEAALFQQQDDDAEQARQALRSAREKLAAQRLDPSVLGLRVSQALMAPSRMGGSQWSNAIGAIADWRQQNQEYQQKQDAQDLSLQEQLSGIDAQSLKSRLALEELRQRNAAQTADTALKVAAKPDAPPSHYSLAEHDVTGPDGQPAKQMFMVDSTTGKVTPFGTPTSAGAGAGSLSQSDIDLLGDRYFETGIIPNVGVGKEAIPIRAAVIHSAAQRALGKRDPVTDASGQGASAAITGNTAGIKAGTSTLLDMTKRTAIADASENTASTNLDLAYSMMLKADQTGSPLINGIQNKIRSGVMGDPDVSAYVNSLTTAANEYARVVSMATGSQGITDAARKEGHDLFNPMLAPEQLRNNIATAKKEMANRTGSLHSQIAQTKQGLYKGPKADSSNTTTQAPADPLGIR
jgi:hypothetical protein